MALSVEWLNHIEAWQRSGLKQTVYCREQGLNYSAFTVRLARYRQQQRGSHPAFMPVQVAASISGVMVLKHTKGHQLELPVSISAAWLAELWRCLD